MPTTPTQQYRLSWMAGFTAAVNGREAAKDVPALGQHTEDAYSRGYQEGQRQLAAATEKAGLEARCFAK